MKIRPVGAELFYADGHGEANISSHPAKPNKIIEDGGGSFLCDVGKLPIAR
jgi:hypothetical protein